MKNALHFSIRFFCVSLTIMFGMLSHAGSAELSCPSSTTLEALIECVSGQMPQEGSGGFVPQGDLQQADIRQVVTAMLKGNCEFALPLSLAGNMRIRWFQDSNNGRSYCVLMEVTSTAMSGIVDKGLGTFIIYPQATRELSQQVPHPKHSTATAGTAGDAYTEREAIRIFKHTNTRSFLMAGARRSANMLASTCHSGEWMSDVAHNTTNMFFAANQALNDYYGASDWTALQWHGKAAATCSNDMYISEGRAIAPAAGAKILRLHAAIRQAAPAWNSEVPGASTCKLNAATNVEGRLLNGVPVSSVCTGSSKASTQKFIHIEQTSILIGSNIEGAAASWVQAIDTAFPVAAPVAPIVAATAGDAKAELRWNLVMGASGYNIQRASAAAGPFALVGNTAGAGYADQGLTNSTAYYYVVTSMGPAGESAYSNIVSVTPSAPFVPPPPANLTASAGARKILLGWTGSGASSYTIKSSMMRGGPYSVIAMGVTETSFLHRELKRGVTYFYVVSAVGTGGVSANSAEASAVAN